MPINPLRDARPPQTTPSRSPSRQYAIRPEQLRLVADETRQRATMRFEFPLSTFEPPLRREDLEGRFVRVAAPVGDRTVVPLQVVERNGESAIVFDATLDLSLLEGGAPLLLAVGEAALLFNPRHPQVVAPSLQVEVLAARLTVDVTASVRHGLREQIADLDRRVAETEAECRDMRDGTSSWFGRRQLEGELEQASRSAAEAQARRNALLSPVEERWRRAPLLARINSAPEVDASWRTAAIAAVNAEAALPAARALLESSLDVPELAQEDRARVAALEATASRLVELEAEVLCAFEALPEDERHRWLVTFAEVERLPQADATREAVRTARDATLDVELRETELRRHVTATDAMKGVRLTSLEAVAAELRRERQALAAELARAREVVVQTPTVHERGRP